MKMKIRIARRWANNVLVRTNTALDAEVADLKPKLKAAEDDRDEAQSAYFGNVAVTTGLDEQLAKAGRENKRLTQANVRLVNDRDELAEELGTVAAENDALHERCADLTDRVEAYERAEAKRRPQMAVPVGAIGPAHAKLIEDVCSGAVNLGTRRRLKQVAPVVFDPSCYRCSMGDPCTGDHETASQVYGTDYELRLDALPVPAAARCAAPTPLGIDDRIDIEYDERFKRGQDTDDLDEVA